MASAAVVVPDHAAGVGTAGVARPIGAPPGRWTMSGPPGGWFPGSGHAPRRALHRDRPGREGMEAELVSRLTQALGPEPARRALVRALDGELSPRATLAQLLLACGSVTAVRELVDEITARTDEDSRAGDSLVRDRADELTRLFVENEEAVARSVARWRTAGASLDGSLDAADGPDGAPADDEVAYYESVFERLRRGA